MNEKENKKLEETEITDSTENNETITKTETTNESKPVEKTFTQTQVTKMATKEKQEGKAAALRELGIDPKDSNAVEALKQLIQSQKTAEQVQAEKALEVELKVKEATERAIVAETKAEIMSLGIKSQFVDDAVILIQARMSKQGNEGADIPTLVSELKTKYSLWFNGSSEEEEKQIGKKGTGSSIKSVDNKSNSKVAGLGSRLAAQRKQINNKPNKSYWSK